MTGVGARPIVEGWAQRQAVLAAILLGAVPTVAKAQELAAVPHRQTIQAAEPTRMSPYRVDTLWQVGGSSNLGGVEIGSGMGLAADRMGRVFISDGQQRLVHVLDAAGRKLRTLGRPGDGPGEFRLPSRIAVGPDGHILVLDEYWARINEYAGDLSFIRTVQLQPRVSVRTLTVTETEFVVSGVDRDGRSGPEILHRFSRETGERLGAHGKQVFARTPAIGKLLPAGPLSASARGGWWYADPGPYGIHRFDASGALMVSIERPNQFLPAAEQAFAVTAADGRLSFSNRPQASVAKILETPQGHLLHQVLIDPVTVVTDEYAIEGTAASPILRLLHSWQQRGMPVLQVPLEEGLYLVNTRDEDLTSGVALVRLTPRR